MFFLNWKIQDSHYEKKRDHKYNDEKCASDFVSMKFFFHNFRFTYSTLCFLLVLNETRTLEVCSSYKDKFEKGLEVWHNWVR